MRLDRAPFRPSIHGCAFSNAVTDRVPIRIGRVPIARVTGGLCGGMVLDALQCWRDGTPPATTSDLSRVFAAQLRSFQVPTAPLNYLRLQRPGASHLRSAVTQTSRDHLAAALIDGQPTPVALVSALSVSPLALSAHHIVLAYRLNEHTDAGSTFAIYDPNYPRDDEITVRLSPNGNSHSRGRVVHAAFALRAR